MLKKIFLLLLFVFLLAFLCISFVACTNNNDNNNDESLMFYEFPLTHKYHIVLTDSQDFLAEESYNLYLFSNLNLREDNDPVTNDRIFYEPPHIIEGVGHNAEKVAIEQQNQHAPSALVHEEDGNQYFKSLFILKFDFSQEFKQTAWGETAIFDYVKVEARGEIFEVKVDITVDFVKSYTEQSKIYYAGGGHLFEDETINNDNSAQAYTLSPDITTVAIERLYISKPEYSDLINEITSLEIQNIQTGEDIEEIVEEYFSLDPNDIKHNDELIFAEQDKRLYLSFSLNRLSSFNYYIEKFPLYADIKLMPSNETITIPIGYVEIKADIDSSEIPSDYINREGIYDDYIEQ